MSGAIHRLARRLNLVIGRGKIKQSDDSGPIQKLQVALSPFELADLVRASEFGFASWPPDNCKAVVLFVDGDRTNAVAIATHDIVSRFKLGNKGETALFDANGAAGVAGKWIWLKKTAGIEVQGNNEPVVVNGAKSVTINAGTDGVIINLQGDCTFNANGHNVKILNPGSVVLSDQNGQKAVARHGDAVVAGLVVASQNAVKA